MPLANRSAWLGLFCGAALLAFATRAAAIAPDEMDPDTAAATQEDLIDPTAPDRTAVAAAAAGEPQSALPPDADSDAEPDADQPALETMRPERRLAGDDAAARPRGAALVRQAFEQSKTAADAAAYSEIIELCSQGIHTGADGPMLAYARQLAAWAHNRRGELHADAEQNTEALDDFAAAAKLDDTKWRYAHNRGVCLATLGKYDEAIVDFNLTIRMNPNYGNAWFNRAELRYEKLDFAGAIEDYTQALRRLPKDSAVYNSRGHAHYRLGDYDEALEDYNQAVRLDPKSAAAYTNRGDAEADLGQFAEAAHDYRAAIRLNPKLGRALQSAAWLMATCPDEAFRNDSLAVEAAQRAISIDGSDDYRYLETLAAALAASGDFDRAIDCQQKAADQAPLAKRDSCLARLELYRQQTPYREPVRQATAGDRQVRRVP